MYGTACGLKVGHINYQTIWKLFHRSQICQKGGFYKLIMFLIYIFRSMNTIDKRHISLDYLLTFPSVNEGCTR